MAQPIQHTQIDVLHDVQDINLSVTWSKYHRPPWENEALIDELSSFALVTQSFGKIGLVISVDRQADPADAIEVIRRHDYGAAVMETVV